MVVWDGRGGTACKKRKISDTTCCSRRLSWVGRIFSPRSVPMVVEKGRTPAEPETKITILLDGSEGTSGCRIGGSWRLSEHILVRRIGRSSRRQHGTRQRLAHES